MERREKITAFSSFLSMVLLLTTGCSRTVAPGDEGETQHPDLLPITGANCVLDPQGIAWDGEWLWVTSEGSLPPYDAYILKIDPRTGGVVEKWPASSYAEGGAAYDGTDLWTTGVHNPNGIQPPWEDPDNFELIYRYSLEDGAPHLIERYAAPLPPHVGIGNGLAFDRQGNLWTTKVIDERYVRIVRLDLLSRVEADFHPGLEDVWATQIAESHEIVLDVGNFWDKGFEWILRADGSDEIIIGGYTRGNSVDEAAVYIVDPAQDYAIKWSQRWDESQMMGPVHIGTFGMAWDRENEVLWTLGGNVVRHSRDSEGAYLEALFGTQ